MSKEAINAALDKKAENAKSLGLDYEPAQQEPVAWRNAAIRVGEDLCSVGPFGYYDMTAEQWLDWALSVVTVHAPPAQRPWVGLTHEEMYMNCPSWLSQEQCKAWIHQIEAALRSKNT
jgi:hypothetical protein